MEYADSDELLDRTLESDRMLTWEYADIDELLERSKACLVTLLSLHNIKYLSHGLLVLTAL